MRKAMFTIAFISLPWQLESKFGEIACCSMMNMKWDSLTRTISTKRVYLSRNMALRGGSSIVLEKTLEDTDQNITGFSGKEYNLSFLASTAGSIAAYRAAVTSLNSTYIDDPYALMFARIINPDKLVSAMSKPAADLARFAVRTYFFDKFVRDAVFEHGIRQVPTSSMLLTNRLRSVISLTIVYCT